MYHTGMIETYMTHISPPKLVMLSFIQKKGFKLCFHELMSWKARSLNELHVSTFQSSSFIYFFIMHWVNTLSTCLDMLFYLHMTLLCFNAGVLLWDIWKNICVFLITTSKKRNSFRSDKPNPHVKPIVKISDTIDSDEKFVLCHLPILRNGTTNFKEFNYHANTNAPTGVAVLHHYHYKL